MSTLGRPELISRHRGLPVARKSFRHCGTCPSLSAAGRGLVPDQEAGGVFANDHVVIRDDDSPLLDDAEPALAHLVSKGVLVNRFNEPMTERIGNPESAP
jgi:hypothetical protein